MHNEKELLVAVSRGNEQAFCELVDAYSAILHSFIYKHTESRELAEEIVQDIFTQVWLTRETLTEVRNFYTYLYVLCRNRAFNELKKLAREKKRLHQWQQEQEVISGGEESGLPYEYLDLVKEAVEQLPAQQKKVWTLSRKDGLTYQQVAEQLQISRETVKSYLKAANTGILKFLTARIGPWIIFLLLKK